MSTTWVVGIDSGGSRTRALLCARGVREAARVEGPSTTLRETNVESVAAALIDAVDRLLASTDGVGRTSIVLGVGLAGAGTAEIAASVESAVAELAPGARVHVGSDMAAAHATAFADQVGALIVAGTGSVAFSIDQEGRERRAGGLGPEFDDGGSGFDLGRAALRAVLAGIDGRTDRHALEPLVLRRMKLRSVVELTDRVRAGTLSRRSVAALAPDVLEAAARGEDGARRWVEEGAEELARLGAAVVAGGLLGFAFAGGLLSRSSFYRAAVRSALERRMQCRIDVGEPVDSAAWGAARLAARAFGLRLD